MSLLARRIAPALRGLSPETKALLDPEPVAELANERKSVIGAGYQSLTVFGGSSSGTEHRADGWDLGTVVVEGYERVVWVFKSVEWIAGNQSRLPFVIGRNIHSEHREILEDHPLYRVLNKRANPMETGRQFRKRLSAQILLSKRGAFVEITRSRMGTITRLDLLPPDRVRPVPDERNGDYLSHYEFYERFGGLREIAPERIRWIREPHPTDPFSGVTPLEAAGISVELDHLSRVYNVSFIKNDGRPGGIVGVDTDTLDDQEMERIERRFAPGATEAGKITVIGTGPGGINYIDTTTRPRDMAYGEAAANAKNEILSAFGLDESVFGAVSNRTFDNAEQALYNAWTQTMPSHLDLISSAFDEDVDDEWDPFIDTSSIEVLELSERKRREEARAEWTAGLRSLDEYRPLAKLNPIDNAYSRALWISPSKAPVPARPEDAAELGIAGPEGPQAGPGGPELATPTPDGAAPTPAAPVEGDPSAAGAVAEARSGADDDTPDAATAAGAVELARGSTELTEPGAAADALELARVGVDGQQFEPGEASEAVDEARKMQRKSLNDGIEAKTIAKDPAAVVYDPSTDEQTRAELAAAAALEAILARQQAVLIARMESPKARKGTRFWQVDGPEDTRGGDRPLDTARILDEDRWVQETTDTLEPMVAEASSGAALALLGAFAAAGVIAGAPSAATAGPELASAAAQATIATSLGVVTLAGEAMRAWLRDVQRRLDTAALAAATIEDLVAALRAQFGDRATPFARSLGGQVAEAAVVGGRDAAAKALTPLPIPGPDGESSLANAPRIVRDWVTQHDDRVRPTHEAADGQTEALGDPFHVGDAWLAFPGDPLGPPAETRECRCWLRYRTTSAARFLLPPL